MAGSSDLPTNLRSAKEAASIIFLGRLVRLDARPTLGVHAGDSEATAVFEVIERFKGKVGKQVSVVSGNGVSCLVRFLGVGTTYLVYANRGVLDAFRLSSDLCSRTRAAPEQDPEVRWLRTGELPPVPLAMRREVVECSELCDLSEAVHRLVGTDDQDSSCLVCDPVKAAAIWTAKKPFYGSQQHEAGRTLMLGRAQDGRGFELAEIAPSDGKCNRRLERRWCRELATNPGEKGTALRCIEPTQAEVLCDELRTRSAHWGPLEEMNLKGWCYWATADGAECEEGLGPPQTRSSGSPSTPILVCRPYRYFRTGDSFRCQVQPDDPGKEVH